MGRAGSAGDTEDEQVTKRRGTGCRKSTSNSQTDPGLHPGDDRPPSNDPHPTLSLSHSSKKALTVRGHRDYYPYNPIYTTHKGETPRGSITQLLVLSIPQLDCKPLQARGHLPSAWSSTNPKEASHKYGCC